MPSTDVGLAATASKEQYLETIWRLGADQAQVALSALAEAMGVSPVSTNEMVKKLAVSGLVHYEPYRGVALTEKGRDRALRVIRRHRLWERFLTDVLELPWDRVHAEACRLEHATSALVEERLAAYLGEPASCPHGQPMPTVEGRMDYEPGRRLSEIEPGESAAVLRVPEGDADLLRYLAELGLEPEQAVTVRSLAPCNGPVTVLVAGAVHAVGRELAGRIFVRPLPRKPEADRG